MNLKISCSLIMLWLLTSLAVYGHNPNQSYLYLRIYESSIGGHFDLTTDDINKGTGLELQRGMTLEELSPFVDQIRAYLKENTTITSIQGEHQIEFTDVDIYRVEGLGDYLKLYFLLTNISEIPDELDISYNAILESDGTHRALVIIEHDFKAGIINNEAIHSLSFGVSDNVQTLSINQSSAWTGLWAMIKSGVWHIWIGLDHILFLLALILPAVIVKKSGPVSVAKTLSSESWMPVQRFKPAVWFIVKIVTFFTISHTITLSLAALGIVELPSRFIESVIAISIALAALHNIFPIIREREWLIAFGFGLFHGFGFASVLSDQGLGGDFMVLSLFGFNLGVEVGQLAIIIVLFPVLFMIRNLSIYPGILVFGSVFLIFVSIYWFIERALAIDLLFGKYVNDSLSFLFG